MRTILLTLVLSSLLGACLATVGPAGPPPAAPPPAEPPPAAPPPVVRSPEPRIIEGTVRDAVTGRPIDRAAVDITSPAFRGEMTVNTGPDGRFRTQEIPPGEFGIRCRREGYESINHKAVMSNGIAHVDCEMTPKHR